MGGFSNFFARCHATSPQLTPVVTAGLIAVLLQPALLPHYGDVFVTAWVALFLVYLWSGATGRAVTLWSGLPAARAALSGEGPVVRRVVDATAAYVRGGDAPRPAGGSPQVFWTGSRRSAVDARRQELEQLQGLEEALRRRVRGQEHVHRAIARRLLGRAAGLGREGRRPVLSALFCGPTGTGKTETAKALAEALGRPLITYDCSQFSAPHDVAALIGAPPGYMGSDRPGKLASDVEQRPDAVLLFDEIEKAYPSVFDVLLPAPDEGRVRDLMGLVADCTGNIFVFTTNLLAREKFIEDPQEVRRALLAATGAFPTGWGTRFRFRPEFLNRIDVCVTYRPLDPEVLAEIAEATIADRLREAASAQQLGDIRLDVSRAVVDLVLSRCDLAFGARDLRRAVESLLGDALVDAWIAAQRRGGRPSELRVRAAGDAVVAEYL